MYFDFTAYASILPFLSRQRRGLREALPEAFCQLSADSTVLDLGCGNAEIASSIASATKATIIAVDPEPVAIDAARVVIASHGVEDLVQLEQVEWQNALSTGPPLSLVLCLHLIYHVPPEKWYQLINLAINRLQPGGALIFMTTSKASEVHNVFAPSSVIRNMVGRSHNLEQVYGRYVFGEDLTPVFEQTSISAQVRTRDFAVRWPFSRPALRFLAEQQPSQIETAWTKLFSFLYRIPQSQVRDEFASRLRFLLDRAKHDLSLEGRDVIHVAVKGS